MPEWYVLDERAARVVAVLLAVALVVVGVLWLRAGLVLFSPPDDVCEGCAPDWFRRIQLVVAIVGVALVAAVVAYLVHVAVTGRTWRRRRELNVALGVSIVAWSVLVLVVAARN